jgi:hypothetical protein
MRCNTVFDPETILMLKAVLDEAIADLPKNQQTQSQKTLLASRLLELASDGERDPFRLRTAIGDTEKLRLEPGAIAPL